MINMIKTVCNLTYPYSQAKCICRVYQDYIGNTTPIPDFMFTTIQNIWVCNRCSQWNDHNESCEIWDATFIKYLQITGFNYSSYHVDLTFCFYTKIPRVYLHEWCHILRQPSSRALDVCFSDSEAGLPWQLGHTGQRWMAVATSRRNLIGRLLRCDVTFLPNQGELGGGFPGPKWAQLLYRAGLPSQSSSMYLAGLLGMFRSWVIPY